VPEGGAVPTNKDDVGQLLGFVGGEVDNEIGTITPAAAHEEPKLGEIASTAISGNDITVLFITLLFY
jgi:hypothetical protein